MLSDRTLKLPDREVTYILKRSWTARSLRVTVHPQKGLMVPANHLIPLPKIEQFLQQHSAWIQNRLQNLSQNHKFSFAPGEILTLLGEDREIVITDTPEVRPHTILEPGKLIIEVPLNKLEAARQFFPKWLERFIRQTLEERTNFYAQKYRLKVGRITIKNQSSLWGSCSTKQNLNFSRRLIQLPLWIIDYVVCHELAHLTHMDHSQKFWGLVGNYYPEYRKARRHLKAFKSSVLLP